MDIFVTMAHEREGDPPVPMVRSIEVANPPSPESPSPPVLTVPERDSLQLCATVMESRGDVATASILRSLMDRSQSPA